MKPIFDQMDTYNALLLGFFLKQTMLIFSIWKLCEIMFKISFYMLLYAFWYTWLVNEIIVYCSDNVHLYLHDSTRGVLSYDQWDTYTKWPLPRRREMVGTCDIVILGSVVRPRGHKISREPAVWLETRHITNLRSPPLMGNGHEFSLSRSNLFIIHKP